MIVKSAAPMTSEVMSLVADRFKALAEPARLAILSSLLEGERTVGELVDATGLGQANVSKHLQVLHGAGFVGRRRDGSFVRYWLVDEDVLRLCDLMCGRLQREQESLAELLEGA
ncbi:MAG: metalloregulator ArsR/SmtB family transcription factor [Gemmatimonadota bacterium]